jgi:hypothetical protein
MLAEGRLTHPPYRRECKTKKLASRALTFSQKVHDCTPSWIGDCGEDVSVGQSSCHSNTI